MSKQRVFIAGHRGMVGSAIRRQLEQRGDVELVLSLIHISEPTRQAEISYAVFCLKKKKKKQKKKNNKEKEKI